MTTYGADGYYERQGALGATGLPEGNEAGEQEAAGRRRKKGGREREPLPFPDEAYVEARAMERQLRLGGNAPDVNGSDFPTTYDGMVLAVRQRRRLQVKPAIPLTYQKTAKDVRAGQALMADMITRVAATLTGGERRLQVIPDDESEREQERVTKLKRWTVAALLGDKGRPGRLQQEAGEPWFELGIDQVCGDGRAIWELTTREEAWSQLYGYPALDDYPDDASYLKATDRFMRQAAFPFRVRRVDPLTYDEWRLEGKAIEAIVIEQRPRREIYPHYGLRPDAAHPEAEDRVLLGDPYPVYDYPTHAGQQLARCVTFWRAEPIPDDEGVCEVVWTYDVDGHRVAQGRTIGPTWHPLPFFSFFGIHTSLPDAHMKGVSVAFLLLRLADSIDTLLSMKFNVAAWLSMPAFELITPEGGYADVATGGEGAGAASGVTASSSGFAGTFQIQPGMGYQLYPGQEIRPILFPESATAMLDSLKADLMELVNLIGIPQALRGASPGAGSAGYLVAQLIAQARTALAPCLDNAADALSQMIQYLWWQVEHRFEEGVPVWYSGDKKGRGAGWITLRPEDVDGRYSVAVSVEPLLPVDKIQQASASLQQQQAGAISMRRHREDGLQLDSPEEEDELIEAEKARQDPLIALPRRVKLAVRLGYLTPQEGSAVLAHQFGLPAAQSGLPAAAQQLNQGVLLGPNGQPLALSGAADVPSPPSNGTPPGAPLNAPGGVPGISTPQRPQAPGMGLPLVPTPPEPLQRTPLPGPASLKGGPAGTPRGAAAKRGRLRQTPGAPGVHGGGPQRQPNLAARAVGS